MKNNNEPRIFAKSSVDGPAGNQNNEPRELSQLLSTEPMEDNTKSTDLEEQGELERQVRIVTKLSTKGGGEQAFVSPSVFDAAEGVREIVTEALTTGVLPDNRIRIKVYGIRGTKVVHLLAEVNVEVRPNKFALYV